MHAHKIKLRATHLVVGDVIAFRSFQEIRHLRANLTSIIVNINDRNFSYDCNFFFTV